MPFIITYDKMQKESFGFFFGNFFEHFVAIFNMVSIFEFTIAMFFYMLPSPER